MIISKKSSIILSSYKAIHAFSPAGPTSCASSRSLSSRDQRCRERRCDRPRRYATIADDDSSPSKPIQLNWPDPPKGHSYPTPYQIFAIAENAPYSKARFYELVKVYHPDRSGHEGSCGDELPRTTQLERYRLVVAAHTILSDPAKRSAYDRWGAGWAGRSDTPFSPAAGSAAQPGPFTSWRDPQDPHIWANATWEDWERWRVRQDPHSGPNRQQGPVLMQNSYFVSIVMAIALIGSSLNYNRADHEGERFLAARDAVHDKASKELRRVRQETGSRAKEERIEWFLRNREATLLGVGVEELREEKARTLLRGQDSCMSEDVRER